MKNQSLLNKLSILFLYVLFLCVFLFFSLSSNWQAFIFHTSASLLSAFNFYCEIESYFLIRSLFMAYSANFDSSLTLIIYLAYLLYAI